VIAVVPVRGAALCAGGAEAVAECDGRAILIGDGAAAAAKELAGLAAAVEACDTPSFAAARWATVLAPRLRDEPVVVLPASPDGRDLAPRLAHVLGRALLAGALRVHARGADLVRWGSRVVEEATTDGPFVATLQPGVRGVEHPPHGRTAAEPAVQLLTLGAVEAPVDATVLDVLPPDVTTMDLAEAPRILGGGAGLDGAERFSLLEQVATALDASMGATRVVTDRRWVGHQRQIGTTGVVVNPRLYVAFGISGAVQHTSGLGQPDHIVSVNIEPHCPMMQMADLAIVADANAVLAALAARLELE
jgi:electron transfer flavoprotein alpha subunit